MKWPRLSIAAAPVEIIDGDRGKEYPKQSDFQESGYCLFLNTGNVRTDGFDFSSCQFISEDKDRRLRKGRLTREDLVMTTRGTIGNVAYFDENVPYEQIRINSGMVIFRVDRKRLLPSFLYHFFRSPDFVGQTTSLRSGVAQPQLPIRDINQIELPLPDVSTQQRIASILSTYDDLIENNRRRMTLLEEAARQAYQEWFVRLRFPGHEHTRIVGGVPEGWERKCLQEITSFLKRGITPAYDDEAEGLVINQKCIRDGRVNMDLARRQSKDVKAERIVQLGDVLINSTGEGTLGRVAQIKAVVTNCTVDTHVTIVRPNASIAKHYFGMAIMEWEPRFSTMGKGATNQTELSPAAIGETEILLPSHTILEQFESLAEPLYAQVTNLTEQNQKLRTARDLLLPKLMSGEIAV